MNGLKYIRTRCNLSLSELANELGVTRQALSSWENEHKEIPPQRKTELAKFFGIDEVYFGEIAEEEKQYLLGKAMFRYMENGKETYRFKPKSDTADLKSARMNFFLENELSLDEQFIAARQKQKATIEGLEDIMKGSNKNVTIGDKITCINRACEIYDMTTQLMQGMGKQKNLMKIPFYYDLLNVLKAMLVAYELMDEKELKEQEDMKEIYGDDIQWITWLAVEIKGHWNKKRVILEEIDKEMKEALKQQKKEVEKSPQKIEECIKEAEEEFRNVLKEKKEKEDN